MKHIVFTGMVVAALSSLAHVAHADDVDIRSFEYLDVVETTDGSVWKGVVTEQQPGVQYKLVTSDGSIHVIKAGDVVKLTKQKNPWHVAAAAAYPVEPTPTGRGEAGLEAHVSPAGSGLPKPFVGSGMRVTADLAIVFGTGDMQNAPTAFAPDIHVGYEQLWGNFGLEGGGLLRWTNWRGLPDGDAWWTLESQVYGRAALHVSRAAPYVGLALGTDTNYLYSSMVDKSNTAVGFGMNLEFGLPIAVTPGIALELGGNYHPGTDTIADGLDKSVAYFALRVGAAGRF
jgi:hypothetical protein